MTSPKPAYQPSPERHDLAVNEQKIEEVFIAKLVSLKYTHRPTSAIYPPSRRRQKFEFFNRVTLTDGEFARLLAFNAEERFLPPSLRRSARPRL